MENVILENSPTVVDESPVKASSSAENFQKFMYELFEKNGVMHDLRSYLRGHIVNVLRSAQTGDLPACQKHFTQRLELTFQAINMLIAEYLLCLEFSYTLSVFVSEIPLANMVFSLAKNLMQQVDIDDCKTRFKDSDIWCILNYLGIKCDSEHASRVLEMYRMEQNSPLLLCILKSAPLYKEPTLREQENSSQESISSNASTESTDKPKSPKTFQEKCRHYVFCKTCQSKMSRVKDKYRKKKKEIAKSLKESSLDSINAETVMKNIDVMEKSLIDEMFNQLKSVYEAEMELAKEEEDRRVKRSIATHSTQLQKRREEMEKSFKEREAELHNSVQEKKRFLWGLARALRVQHRNMTRAMRDVRAETDRLTAKKDSLKSQLVEAEQTLKQRGEDMRQQISSELLLLAEHLESMKRERDSINRERMQLEQYKDTPRNEALKSHYDLLNNELVILKKYLENARVEPKCVMERGTLTELNNVTTKIDIVLNNGQDASRSEDKAQAKLLVNDFKKQKNVNFCQSNLDEMYRERSLSRSRSSGSSEAGDAHYVPEHGEIHRLADENQRLRDFATQQREHIDRLSVQQARLQAELTAERMRVPALYPFPSPTPAVYPLPLLQPALAPRPQTAPNPPMTRANHQQGLSGSASVNQFSLGWRKGAGEELSLFSSAQPRIVLPGDRIPFVGCVTRHADNKRHLINQWRSLRRRVSPVVAGVIKPHLAVQRYCWESRVNESPGPSVNIKLQQAENNNCTPTEIRKYVEVHNQPKTPERVREKSPKSVLREAKEKLKNTDCIKDYAPATRAKSPNCVLREAKLRLRKLEIEAEAVEKSYLDFRRKQNHFRGTEAMPEVKGLDTEPYTSTYKLDETFTKTSNYKRNSSNYDIYYKEYQKLDLGTHFTNKNTAAVRINPIPTGYSHGTNKTENYLETPLTEFRKFYNSERRSINIESIAKSPSVSDKSDTKGTRKEIISQAKNDKVKELELLKHNIGKIYNMPVEDIEETPPNESNDEIDLEFKITNDNDQIDENNGHVHEEKILNEIQNDIVEISSKDDRNHLRIEVESFSEVNDVKVTDSQDLLLVVESSVGSRDDELVRDQISTQMTIIVSPKRSTGKQSTFPDVSKSNFNSQKAVTSGSVKSDKISEDCLIYNSENEHVSSVEMKLELPRDVVDNVFELEQNEDPDYPDDFSADVDNYNSRSEVQSPISLPKTSEDENFWDT